MSSHRPWARRILLASALAICFGWLPYQAYGHSGLARLLKLRAEVAALRASNAELRAHNRQLRAERGLEGDDELGAVERIARDELGLVKPGEIVFKVEEGRAMKNGAWSRLGLRGSRALSIWWSGLAATAGAALIWAGAFRDLDARVPESAGRSDGKWLPIVAVLMLGGALATRLAAVLRSLWRAKKETRLSSLRRDAGDWKSDLQLGLLLLACAYAAFQATGESRSLLHPVAYALVAFLVTFQRRGVGLFLVAAAMGFEVLLVLSAASVDPSVGGLHGAIHTVPTNVHLHEYTFLHLSEHAAGEHALLISHLVFLGFFALMHALFLRTEVARQQLLSRARLVGEVTRIKDDARDFRLIGTQLSAESRTRSREEEEDIIAAASVDNIHQALFYTLELLKKSLDLHTCVLLWLDESGDSLRIKELATDSDSILDRPIPITAGAVGAVIKDRLPVRLAHPKPEHLPYYDTPQPVGAFVGVPVLEEAGSFPSVAEAQAGSSEEDEARHRGHLRGVLIADRLVTKVERGEPAAVAFDERDQRLLVGAAREILRAIQAERVFVAVERGKYEHERFFRASDQLNRALTPEQVFETAFAAARELCDFDFAAIALYDKHTRRHRVVAAVGDGAEEVAGLEYGENAGLAAMAVKTRHALPSTGQRRDKDMPVYTKRVKLRGLESLLVLPLIAADEAIGTFTLAARAPRRFVKDKRELLGVIANQVAVSTKNAEMYRAMEQMATTDGLTGLVNHRTFQERYADLIARAERQGQPVTLLLTDIDHFKKVNDTYGHPTGDVVLKGVANVCRDEVRKVDIAARYGGEEFAIVLDGTDREGARLLAERIRKQVAAQIFSSDKGPFGCTLSLGIATWPHDGRDTKALIAHADQALYFAKHNGRNRAVAFHDLPQTAPPTVPTNMSVSAESDAPTQSPPLRAVR